MIKYFLLVGTFILGGLAFIFFWVGVPTIYSESVTARQHTHFYDNPEQSIANIKLRVFYFVPQDKQDQISPDWRASIVPQLNLLNSFHQRQTQGKSNISNFVQPEPIIGLKASLDYDTINTNGGNPEGLRRVAQELIARRYIPARLNETSSQEYLSYLIVYEGVGATASENVAFINHAFLNTQEFQESYGASFLAHEFYHTLGVPDAFTVPDDIPLAHDLMGVGRYRPLEQTYLNDEVLVRLGL